jgi:hypothetical protein
VGYRQADRALFPEMKRMMHEHTMSPSAAARKLVDEKKVRGSGSPESKAKRLAAHFLKERRRRSIATR